MGEVVSRQQVLGFRVRAQQLDQPVGGDSDAAVLDLGVQDTGPDGGHWALAIRGAAIDEQELALLWTVRGAPHYYRRADLPSVAAAVAPFSDADAAKRIYDAAKPLKAAGIGIIDALDTVAETMRSLVATPMVKGELSGRLAELLPAPYLRYCRPCDATHLFEMPFRLAAVRAGLELTPGTSPPVLRPAPELRPAARPEVRHELVRGYLRLLGPATPKHAAEYLDSPVAEVRKQWPADAVEVAVDGQQRWVLDTDLERLAQPPPRVTRLLGPYDAFLQARDRQLLVPDPAHSRALWPVLGRPGAVLADGDIVGTWRPRTARGALTLRLQLWPAKVPRRLREAIEEQAEQLAAFRGVRLAGLDLTDS